RDHLRIGRPIPNLQRDSIKRQQTLGVLVQRIGPQKLPDRRHDFLLVLLERNLVRHWQIELDQLLFRNPAQLRVILRQRNPRRHILIRNQNDLIRLKCPRNGREPQRRGQNDEE